MLSYMWRVESMCMFAHLPFFLFPVSICSDCRECGLLYCSRCSSHRIPLEHLGFSQSVRVCDACFDKVTAQLQSPSSAASANAALAVAAAAAVAAGPGAHARTISSFGAPAPAR
jgi:hypothetical protein